MSAHEVVFAVSGGISAVASVVCMFLGKDIGPAAKAVLLLGPFAPSTALTPLGQKVRRLALVALITAALALVTM